MTQRLLAAFSLIALAACAVAQVPDNLRPAPAEVALHSVLARGVQIYECRAKKDDPQAAEWAFVAPEAALFDAQGTQVGKHYAGPRWESLDGSRVVGSTKARADATTPGAIPWLLLTAQSEGPDGAFAKVTSVQRINTVGGVAPAAGECTSASLGKQARSAYTADYVMYGSK
ncbi:MAG TPA: DUF3455 domain-containing protein [Albitalea sp.]|nr:DUF3455 domain-containing protein [Albitalea sp.]